jgi:hypothetical protein
MRYEDCKVSSSSAFQTSAVSSKRTRHCALLWGYTASEFAEAPKKVDDNQKRGMQNKTVKMQHNVIGTTFAISACKMHGRTSSAHQLVRTRMAGRQNSLDIDHRRKKQASSRGLRFC